MSDDDIEQLEQRVAVLESQLTGVVNRLERLEARAADQEVPVDE